MQTARLLAIAFLAISWSASAIPQPVQTTFQWPAQMGPELGISGASWVLLLIPREGNTSLQASFPDGADVTEHAKHFYGEVHGPYAGSTGGVRSEDASSTLGPAAVSLGRSTTWSSIFVSGSGLRINTTGLTGQVVLKDQGACLDQVPAELDGRYDRLARLKDLCPPGMNAVVALRSDSDLTRGAVDFSLQALDADVIEWHGMAVSCTTSACPNGGQRTNQTTPLPTGHEVSSHDYTFVNLDPKTKANISGRGQAAVVLVGGASLDVAVNGWIRFPEAGLEGCPSCTPADGRTLQATGAIDLLGLHPEGNRRMGTHLSGNALSARLDESAIDPALLGFRIAGAVTATAAVGVLLLYFLSSLFTRHKEEGPLANERRRRLYEHIVKHPGIHFREALRGADIPAGSGRHHVTKLVQAGLIVEKRHRNSVCLFENHGKYDAFWQDLAALRDPDHRLLHDWIKANPDMAQNEIVAAFQQSHHWMRSTTQDRVERLVRDGVVQFRFQGRYKLYSIARPVADLKPVPVALVQAGPA